ncbi:LppP/LprE family lipoprotein [Nocardia higoensis]|uniref:LppP/LprE family lipoprotein n=1 Tax=Nocardia higoensis TaxID=228599 RepID=A0ABS0D8V1_9NOCA|nr:LppP/LprE family lipoprotein [Nocardia higoensis]MBF6353203.1 LppP/LprE family lipoprotein [Nocardia higoensis]
MNVRIPALATLAVIAGLLTGCDGDDGPITPPNSVAAPTGASRPGGAEPTAVDSTNEPGVPTQATPAPTPAGDPGAVTGPAETAPGTSEGSGNEMCLDPDSGLVTSAIAGLEPTASGEPWRIREVGTDPVSQGCDDLLSYVAVEGSGMHPAVYYLFFTEGRYLGTGSDQPYAYTNVIDKAPQTVSVEYRWQRAEDPGCCPQGGPNLVVYYLSVDGVLTVNGEFPPR